MQDEFDVLTRNSTWTLVRLSDSHSSIGCKWVFRIKYNPDGTLKQHKARLVAKGFHQRPGLDYSETFSPVIKPTTIRLILSLAVTHGWSLRQIDVNNAFLQGTLNESKSQRSFQVHSSYISNRFSLKDLGPLSYFLSMEVTPTSSDLHLNQSKYVSDILARHNMLDCNPATTPMLSHQPLVREDEQPIEDVTTYRVIVGSLQYLSLTTPDIAFPVNKLAQFLTHPTSTHWSALKGLLRFLKGSLHHGIHLRKDNPFNLHAYCDADWAGDRVDYLSTTGYVVFVGQHPVS